MQSQEEIPRVPAKIFITGFLKLGPETLAKITRLAKQILKRISYLSCCL